MEANTDLFNLQNTFLDPQFYYSTFDTNLLNRLTEVPTFPSNITRRDWRNKESAIIDFLKENAEATKSISNTLVTPGFYIDNLDWHFDYSIEIYNYCRDEFEFDNYALSMLIHCSFFNNQKNVEEMIEDLDDLCKEKDFIYLVICHDVTSESNYEEIDPNALSNILSFIYKLKKMGFKLIIGYSFINSILFAMLDCEYIATGWFNTLRKFEKNRLEPVETFGRRKKRYTSVPLLSNIMIDDIKHMTDTGVIKLEEIVSGTSFDDTFVRDNTALSFVDLEHQYWESLSNIFSELNNIDNINEKIEHISNLIEKAIHAYEKVSKELEISDKREILSRIKTSAKHLYSWQIAIDLFKDNELLL